MRKVDNTLTLYRVACYYYNDGLSQQEIADLEGLSRSQISHLLTEARNRGIVEITVSLPSSGSSADLAQDVKNFLGISKVYIIDVPQTLKDPENRESLYKKAGQAAAVLLPKILDNSSVIGIGRGRTVLSAALALPNEPPTKKTFVPLAGNAGNHFDSLQTPVILSRFAMCFKAEAFYINSPAYQPGEPTALQRDELSMLENYWDSMDACVFALGDMNTIHTFYHGEEMPVELLDEDSRKKARGEICGRPFSTRGEIDWQSHSRNKFNYISIPLKKLKNVKKSVCIVCGSEKITPLLTASKLNYLNTLIIDSITARTMLNQ